MAIKKDKENIKNLLGSMKVSKQLGIIVAVSISLSLIFSQAAYASTNVGTFDQTVYAYYIDAGTAGLIVQGLVGALAAGLAMAVVFRARLSHWVKSKFGRSHNSGEEEDTEDGLSAGDKSEPGD